MSKFIDDLGKIILTEEWIFERYKCFGTYDEFNNECIIYCSKRIMKKCKERKILQI